MESSQGRNGFFDTTQWNLVLTASQLAGNPSREAFEKLCRIYWSPLYFFLRRRGMGVEDAEDHVQGFFAHILQTDILRKAESDRGRFRTFLLTCLMNYVANEGKRSRARKRGGGIQILSLDIPTIEGRYQHQLAGEPDPETIFNRQWAITLIDQTFSHLHDDYERRGKTELYEKLQGHLYKESDGATYRQVAEALGMTENAIKAAASRMRKRFGDLLRKEIAGTVACPEDVEDEIRTLYSIFD